MYNTTPLNPRLVHHLQSYFAPDWPTGIQLQVDPGATPKSLCLYPGGDPGNFVVLSKSGLLDPHADRWPIAPWRSLQRLYRLINAMGWKTWQADWSQPTSLSYQLMLCTHHPAIDQLDLALEYHDRDTHAQEPHFVWTLHNQPWLCLWTKHVDVDLGWWQSPANLDFSLSELQMMSQFLTDLTNRLAKVADPEVQA